MGCPVCGSDVAENQKFCHECGAALGVDQPTAPTDATDELPEPTEPLLLTEPPTLEVAAPVIEPLSSADDVTEPTFIIDGAASGLPSTITTLDTTTSTPTTATPTPTPTAEMPAVFDGSNDLAEYPPPREPFRVRVVFILSLFGAIAVLMAVVADVVDIRTTRPAAGIVTGPRTLADLGGDLGPAAFAGAAVMVLGGLLTCFGLRWGAGLAGGAGLALAGWAGLSIGLAEVPIAIAQSITRTSTEEFTLRVTRDIGWWLIIGVGVVGVLVFVASLRSAGTGGHRALNPLVAAVTAVASVILGFGPLIPVGDATFADNFRSPDPNFDLPTAFFAGRLGQVGLIVAAGVVGMLIVRNYGLGLAAGATSVAVVLWVASLAELGSRPIGIADRNPGATTTIPHAVTSVGMVSTLALLALAAALATYRSTRQPTS
jgi:zinc-ribbon domain